VMPSDAGHDHAGSDIEKPRTLASIVSSSKNAIIIIHVRVSSSC